MEVHPSLRMVIGILLFSSSALAGKMVVRVNARIYDDLRRAIDFKGTTIEIVGARIGESYDLMLERGDYGQVAGSGLVATVICDDTDTRKSEIVHDGQYQSYDELKTVMRNWAANYPEIVRIDSIGPTYEGRYIYMVKISDNPNADEDEPEVLLDAQHHSREWAAGQAARHFADTLITNYATNQQFRDFVDNHEVWVIPIVNVDGFVYDYPAQRYWRKNRQPFGSSTGCDPNRDYNGCCNGDRMGDWGSLVSGSRTSHRPSDETWFGARGAWGLEVNALAEFFKQRTFVANVSLHSYSELVLWPYGYGPQIPDNAFIASLGTRAAAQMSTLGGGTYEPEQSVTLYPNACGSCDWMYGWAHYVGGFPCMSYVFELGTDFYQPTGELDVIERECFDGLWFIFSRADSIRNTLQGMVPRPILAPIDTSASGDFRLHWTSIRPEYNRPDGWDVEELSGLTVGEDGFEAGLGRWLAQGATASTTQKHTGSYSAYLGTGNNISNFIMTADPYPVQPGDSLTYWIWYNVESNYDVTVAEVSLEGKEWIQLHDRFTGNSNGWLRKAWSLEPWVGKSVYVRFRYMTDDGTTNAGVYIDDVRPVPTFASRTVIATGLTDTICDVVGKAPGQYWYRVRGHNAAWGYGDWGPLEDVVVSGTGVTQDLEKTRVPYELHAVPNPASGRALVRFVLPRAGAATVAVADASGRVVRALAAGQLPAGEFSLVWDGRDDQGKEVPAGLYYVRLSGIATATARLAIIR